jgi:hypothetical protein
MKNLIRFVVSIVVPAFIIAGGVANSVMAQETAAKGAPVQKAVMENAKVKVYEVSYKPGDTNTGIASTSYRVVRAVTAGTTQWTLADGKMVTNVRKAGDVWISEPGPAYSNSNTGKTDFKIYVVQLK